MFENIAKFFRKLMKSEEKPVSSKETAKERLHLVLMQDRANVSADFLELMKQEIIEVIKKYIEVEESAIDVRLTNEVGEDGSKGAPSLYANIPILNIKNDMKSEINKQENKSSEEKDKESNNKENKDEESKKSEEEKVEEETNKTNKMEEVKEEKAEQVKEKDKEEEKEKKEQVIEEVKQLETENKTVDKEKTEKSNIEENKENKPNTKSNNATKKKNSKNK